MKLNNPDDRVKGTFATRTQSIKFTVNGTVLYCEAVSCTIVLYMYSCKYGYGILFADQLANLDRYLLMRITMMRRIIKISWKDNCSWAFEYESMSLL